MSKLFMHVSGDVPFEQLPYVSFIHNTLVEHAYQLHADTRNTLTKYSL